MPQTLWLDAPSFATLVPELTNRPTSPIIGPPASTQIQSMCVAGSIVSDFVDGDFQKDVALFVGFWHLACPHVDLQ